MKNFFAFVSIIAIAAFAGNMIDITAAFLPYKRGELGQQKMAAGRNASASSLLVGD
jgi:hypothetical protein